MGIVYDYCNTSNRRDCEFLKSFSMYDGEVAFKSTMYDDIWLTVNCESNDYSKDGEHITNKDIVKFCRDAVNQFSSNKEDKVCIPEIKRVIFNDPATIVYWEDNTKTVVKCGEYDEFNPEFGLAMAISKKALGNTYDYYEVFKKWIPELDEEDSFDWLICNMDIVACGFNYKWNDAHDEVTINMYHDEVGDNIFIIAKDFAYKWDEENNKVVVSAYDIHRYKKIKQNQ